MPRGCRGSAPRAIDASSSSGTASTRKSVDRDEQSRARGVDDGVQEALERDVAGAAVLGDDQPVVLPVGRERRAQPAERHAAEHEHGGQGQAADHGPQRTVRLDLAATGRSADERRREPATAERLRLDEVLLGGHRVRAPRWWRRRAAGGRRARCRRGRRRGGRDRPGCGGRAPRATRPAPRRRRAARRGPGRQPGCSWAAATAATARPRMPVAIASSTEVRVRLCRVRSSVATCPATASRVPARPGGDQLGRGEQGDPAGGEGHGDHDVVPAGDLGAHLAPVDLGGVGTDLGLGAGGVRGQPARGEADPGQHVAEHDGDDEDHDARGRHRDLARAARPRRARPSRRRPRRRPRARGGGGGARPHRAGRRPRPRHRRTAALRPTAAPTAPPRSRRRRRRRATPRRGRPPRWPGCVPPARLRCR